jgi:hypothetical protein
LPIIEPGYCNGYVVEYYSLAPKSFTHVTNAVEEVLTLGTPEVVIEEHLSSSEDLIEGVP